MARMTMLKDWMLRQNPVGPLLAGCFLLAVGPLFDGVLPWGIVFVAAVSGLGFALWAVVTVINIADRTP